MVEMVEMVDGKNVLRRITLVERRLVEIEAGGERFYHLDNIVDMEHINAWEFEDTQGMDDAFMLVGDMELLLWSDDPLARPPPEPSAEVDRAADAVEIQPLQIMGALVWKSVDPTQMPLHVSE